MANYSDYQERPTQAMPGTPPYERPMPHERMPMYPGYGYGMNRFGMRPLRMFPGETKPFYLTSEFVVSLLAAIAIAITAASSTAFGAWRAWILIAVIVAAYTLSRGIAKAGTHSHTPDPRNNVDLNWHREQHPQHRPAVSYPESAHDPGDGEPRI